MANTTAHIVVDKFLKEALNDMEIENHFLSAELIEKLATEPGTPNYEMLEAMRKRDAACPPIVVLGKTYGRKSSLPT